MVNMYFIGKFDVEGGGMGLGEFLLRAILYDGEGREEWGSLG